MFVVQVVCTIVENILMTYTIKQQCVLAYQICAKWGVDEGTYTHISMRDDQEGGFWIKPHGLLFEEVNVDNLVLMGLDGQLKSGHTGDENITGTNIHGGIYRHRPDVVAVIHLHTPATVAISSDPKGLRMLSQWALHFYQSVGLHAYDSLALSDSQGDNLARDLAERRVCLMAHHGFVAVGTTMAEALYHVHHFEHAAKAQVMMSEAALANEIPEDICLRASRDLLGFEKNLGERDFAAAIRMLSPQVLQALLSDPS